MAITFNTDRLQGLEGTTINGVYGRIQIVTVKKYDATTNPDVAASFRLMYDVILHSSADKRNASGEYPEWGNRLRSRAIDHFVCTVERDSRGLQVLLTTAVVSLVFSGSEACESANNGHTILR